MYTQYKLQVDKGHIGVVHWKGMNDDPPIVALHGFLDSPFGWEDFAQASGREIYALALPGFTTSSTPKKANLDTYVQMISQAIIKLDLNTDYYLIGHSMGGMLSSYIAYHVPKPKKLLLVAPAGYGRIPVAEFASNIGPRQTFAAGLPLFLYVPPLANFIYKLGVSGGHNMPFEMKKRLRNHIIHNTQGAYLGLKLLADFSKGLKNHTVLPPPIPTDLPIYSLWGAKDQLIPISHYHNFKKLFPQAHTELWNSLAHHPHVEDTNRFHHWAEKSLLD